MGILSATEWRSAQAIAEIGYTNPFLPERIELEKRALGKRFVSRQSYLQFRADQSVNDMFPNAQLLRQRSRQLLEQMRDKLVEGQSANDDVLEVYENLALYHLYASHMAIVREVPIEEYQRHSEEEVIQNYDAYARDFKYFLCLPGRPLPTELDKDVVFAGLFQIERAFFHIFRFVIGTSLQAANLRASIWQSVFTHDMRRYMRSLYRQMGDISTLITGPTGTGKELVARAIGYSRFVGFDQKKRAFVANTTSCFFGVNLSAISSTLIESELFGHAKGAFTDAKAQRFGLFDPNRCPSSGTVFLDEIGELEPQLQVKLLRVLQTREFNRLGDPKPHSFVGKIVTATNRDLNAEIDRGTFREDLYYRLCADQIETPSLASQLKESPEDIKNFVQFISMRILPDLPGESERLTDEVVVWIDQHLGSDYPWPGNIRELEQCVRSVMIRGHYSPSRESQASGDDSQISMFLQSVRRGELSRSELLRQYFSLVYTQSGGYRSAGRRLEVDWRTVKELIDEDFVRRIQSTETT